MKITIINKIGRPAKDYLTKFKKRFPEFKLTTDKVYNGIVVEIDDEDIEAFAFQLDSIGFNFETDQEEDPEKD